MATVEVAFTPLPAHVRTARLVATAVARRSGVDEALLDEVRLAVGEACSRAVEEHRRHCPAEPVRIEMTDLGERFEVVVRDAVPPAPAKEAGANGSSGHGGDSQAGLDASAIPAGFGLAVISGLADDVRISATGTGVSVRMTWPAAAVEPALPGRSLSASRDGGPPDTNRVSVSREPPSA
jgi:serine/threonine-protein kinase RsbW